MIGAVARDDFALRPAAGLARKLHGMLVGVGAAQGEEYPSPLESGEFQELLGQRRARPGAPARIHEAQGFRLFLNGMDQTRVLVAQVHAFRQAAHVDVGVTRFIPEPRTLSADDGGRVPLRLNTPAMQYTRTFRHRGTLRHLLIRIGKPITICGMRSVNVSNI